MSIQNKTAMDLVPASDMKSFMDELGRVTDRETFNSIMKRFDESFMQRYQSTNRQERGKFPFGATPEQSMPRPPPQVSQPYSNLGSFYQGDPQRYQGDPRQTRYPPEVPLQAGYQTAPAEYPPRFKEDSYSVPMYNRGFYPDSTDKLHTYPRTDYEKPMGYPRSEQERPYIYGEFEKAQAYPPRSDYEKSMGYPGVPQYDKPPTYAPYEFDKPQGYIRTEYTSYPQTSSSPYLNPVAHRNPIQESIDLRKVKEDLLLQTKTPEQKILEQNLPPPRYDQSLLSMGHGQNLPPQRYEQNAPPQRYEQNLLQQRYEQNAPPQRYEQNLLPRFDTPNYDSQAYPSAGSKSFYTRNN